MKKILFAIADAVLSICYYVTMVAMLPMPDQVYPPPDMVFTWKLFRKNARWKHAALAFVGLSGVIGCTSALLANVPITRYTLIGTLTTALDFIGSKLTGREVESAPFVWLVFLAVLIFGKKAPILTGRVMGKGLPLRAMAEEQTFRAGAEDWNIFQKVFASLAFGAIHFANIIYPLAVCVSLAMLGLFLIAIYMRELKRTGSVHAALIECATLHMAYNTLAIGIAILAFVLIVVTV